MQVLYSFLVNLLELLSILYYNIDILKKGMFWIKKI